MLSYDPQATPRARMLRHMLALQNRANVAADPEWFTAGHSWTRAIMVETVELMEHYNSWKWWKKRTEPALYQAQFEQVDVWHFALSWFMQRFGSTDENDWVLNQAIMRRVERALRAAEQTPSLDNEAFHRVLEKQVEAAARGVFDTDAFFLINKHLGLSFERLYEMYVGKNTLNVFRQLAGYKQGTYAKHWQGKEDNEVLEQIQRDLQALGLTGPEYSDALLARLRQAYEQACRADDLRVLVTADGPVVVRPHRVTKYGAIVELANGTLQKVESKTQFEALPKLPQWSEQWG